MLVRKGAVELITCVSIRPAAERLHSRGRITRSGEKIQRLAPQLAAAASMRVAQAYAARVPDTRAPLQTAQTLHSVRFVPGALRSMAAPPAVVQRPAKP